MDKYQFNPITKVYEGLERRLPVGEPSVVHVDRYSIDEAAGIASQVGRSTRALLAAGDSDVAKYLDIPEEAFDAARTDLHAAFGISWLRLSDIHPNAVGSSDVGGLVLIGSTLFCRLTIGAVTRQINRLDGDDENAYTVLVLALSAHYAGHLQRLRWADDVRRAGRDNANWAGIVRRCRERGQGLEFGGKLYDASSDSLLLTLLGGMVQQDDVTRRKSLGGGRLEHLMRGGAGMAERQMPYGWRHQRQSEGRRVRTETGFVPEVDWAVVPVLRTAWTMHAEGADYVAIGRYLAEHRIARRGTLVPEGSTFADLLGRPGSLGGAAKSLFVVTARDPHTELDLYLGKVTLMASGVWPYRVGNDLAERGVRVAGLMPTYRDEHDPKGWFDLQLAWGWPKDPTTGLELPRWGLTSEQLEASRQRLIEELRAPRRKPQPGHGLPTDRALSDFGTWVVDDGRYPEPTQYGVGPRQNNTGRNNAGILCRPLTESTDEHGKPIGWHNHNRAANVAWTFSLSELCADLAHRIDRLVEDGLLDPAATVPATVVRAPGDADERRKRQREQLQARLAGTRAEHATLLREADGLRTAAGILAADGNRDGFAEYHALAQAKAGDATAKENAAASLQQKIEALDAQPGEPADIEDHADVSLAAYLVAGLRRAAASNGRGPARLRLATRDAFSGWEFHTPARDRLAYQVTLALPLLSGGTMREQLSGQVRNVRVRAGKAAVTPDIVADAVLRDGRDIDEVAATIAETSRKKLVTARLMPWLRDRGVTSRGAKCAIIDHPIQRASAVVHEAVTGQDNPRLDAWPHPVRELIAEVYTDPDLQWGDSAVPDNLERLHRLTATLALPDVQLRGLPVTEAALLLGIDDKPLRQLVMPPDRPGSGFTRPRYLEYVRESDKQRITAIACPHGRCRGLCDLVVLLPEVARSGYGVLCSTCRRAPNTSEPRWARLAFPIDYARRYTGRGGVSGSLRDQGQTFPVEEMSTYQITAGDEVA